MDGSFLAVHKELYGLGLKSIEILIVSQVYEFQKQGLSCYITDEQFSSWFGESLRTVQRSIKSLDELNIIDRKTSYVDGNGRGNRQRVIRLNPKGLWKLDTKDNGTANMATPNDGTATMAAPLSDGTAKSEQWYRHNGGIKENLKEKSSIRKEKQSIEEKRELEDLDDGELLHIKRDYENKMPYNDIGAKYNIKQKYLNKDIATRINNILFIREQSGAEDSDSSDCVEYFDDDDSGVERLSKYLDGRQSKEILDALDSFGDDSRARMHYQLTLPQQYGIPKAVIDRFDFIDELKRLAA